MKNRQIYKKLDPALLHHVQESSDFAFADGALPRKYKLLIGMAFDASYAAVNGLIEGMGMAIT